jgi:hypothetical protein
VYYYSINANTNNLTLIYSTAFGAGNTDQFCFSDMSTSFVWMYRGDAKITRGGFSGSTWATGGTTGAYPASNPFNAATIS